MTILEFLANEKIILSHGQGRRLIFQGAIKVNNIPINIKDFANVELNKGDKINIGKKTVVV